MPDCSLLSRAYIASQFLPGAKAVLDQLQTAEASMAAPYLLQAEFVSTVRSLERRGIMSAEHGRDAITTFWGLPIRYDWDPAWVPRALEIARSIGASRVYDSIYLACAESYGFTLYTCDDSFARAFDVRPHALRLVS
ncbi:MAG TPA: type II toxin-antitoxin system VapC family toxin [Tepidiformaceae bacterium]|nr:type II toxin-antitoxin system VapC family toxin [Tepidiformaceae bacterium]